MSKERIACLGADCSYCQFGIRVPQNMFSEVFAGEKYSCKFVKGKHKRIYASDCGEFRCKRERCWPYEPDECTGGKI